VVVEGGTSDGQLAVLRDMGHRYLQGYAFSRPLEGEQLADGTWSTCAGAALTGAPSVPAP
jgi:EAL domain-containing protein (putative c-di-GMP-specific phosphodiesterase class I)